MTKKHLQFCIYYMQVGDPQVAYKMTYPRAAVKSLAAASSRLMARPDVAEWVNGTEERVHNRMMRQFHNEHYDQFKEKLLTINEKRTVLTKIIKGETKRVRYIKGKYGLDRVEEDLPVYAVLRAVDLDTRLENFYNYLTRSDTWRKTQNIYVNTPTLQQQVNILISQSTENEETKIPPLNLAERSHEQMRVTQEVPHEHGAEDVHSRLPQPQVVGRTDNTSPHSGDLGVHSRWTDTEEQTLSPAVGGVTAVTGVGYSRGIDNTSSPLGGVRGAPSCRTIAQEIPPCKEVAHERVTEDVHSRGIDNTSSPLGGVRGASSCRTIAQEIPPCKEVAHERVTEDVHSRLPQPQVVGGIDNTSSPLGGVRGASSRRTPHTKKTPRYLTTVNKPVTNPCQSTTCNPPHIPTG